METLGMFATTPTAFYSAAAPRSPQYTTICSPVGLVTFASGCLETTAVQDRDVAAVIADEDPVLQRSGGLGDADPTHAQHMPEKLVREMNCVRVRAVLSHQQPAGKTRLDHVEARTGGRLREL